MTRILGAVCLACLGAYLMWVGRQARSTRDARAKLARHLDPDGGAPRDASGVIDRVLRKVESTRPAIALRQVFEVARLPIGWDALLRCWLASVLVVPVAAALLTGTPAAIPAAAVLATALPGVLLKSLARARQRRAEADCDGLAADLALFLRTGMRVEDALALCAREAAPAVGEALGRFQAQIALGADVDSAFREMAEDLGNRDLQLIGQAMATSHETGSDIGRIMDTIGETVRERSAIRRELGTQTIQGRLSGRVVAALPLIFLCISAVISKSTISVLLGTVPGLAMLAAAVAMNVAGFLWIRRILDIKE